MEPIISLLEKKQHNSDNHALQKPLDDLTSYDSVRKYALLDTKICIERTTKETKVRHETTDDE